jgi:Rieske Fe-S protein
MALGTLPSRARAEEPAAPKRYARAKLVDRAGQPIRAEALAEKQSYLFFYPYAGTPCFLFNLGKPLGQLPLRSSSGESYQWPGGAGRNQAIVSYSAICAHQLTRPSPVESVINYRPDKTTPTEESGIISCCAHKSSYDPAAGAKVLAGEARHPLTTILLDYDAAADDLFAVGTAGEELFADFFKAYAAELRTEFGPGVARQEVGEQSIVMPFGEYTKQQYFC